MKKINRSFGSYKHDDGSIESNAFMIAKTLSKNWGDIPKHLSDLRAFEVFCLAKSFLILRKKLKSKGFK